MAWQDTDFVPQDAATRFEKNRKAHLRFELFGMTIAFAFCFWAGFIVGCLVMVAL